MALSSKKAVLVATTASASQSVTGFGFTPKAILFWTGNMQAAEGLTTHQTVSIGVAIAAAQRATYAGWQSASSANTGTNYAPTSTAAIVLGVGTTISRSGSVTLDADGFSVNWGTTPTVAGLVHYLAVGGSSLLDTGISAATVSGTGSKSVTGMAFTPDAVIFLGCNNTGVSQHGISMGAALSSTKRWAWAVNSLGGATAPNNWAKSMQRTDRCLLGITNAGLDVEVDFTAFTSTGCTLNAITNPSGFVYVALFLRTGGLVDIGSYTKSSAVNGSNVVTPSFSGGGNFVVSVFEASIGKAASTGLRPDSNITLGGFTAAAGGDVWSGSVDAKTPSDAHSFLTSAKALTLI